MSSPDLTFGPLLNSEGGNVGPIVLFPTFPKAHEGFDIQWTDLNASQIPAGVYTNKLWITDDKNDGVVVWWREFQVPGLAGGQTRPHVYPVRAYDIARGTYTFHVWINAVTMTSAGVFEWNRMNNYSFNGNIRVG